MQPGDADAAADAAVTPLVSWLPTLLQLSDSVFPTGGYAHSFGMEEVVRIGLVRDEATLRDFLTAHAVPALERVELPIVRLARAAARRANVAELASLDALAGALKLPRELREASIQTGRRRLATLVKLRPSPVLEALDAGVTSDRLAGHHCVVWGAACETLPVAAALTGWYVQSLTGLCMAAPKLIRIGQEAAQRTLTALLDGAAASVDRSMAIALDEIGWFDPVVDLASMRHERAAERMFIS